MVRALGDLCVQYVPIRGQCLESWTREKEKRRGTALFSPGFALIVVSTCSILAGYSSIITN